MTAKTDGMNKTRAELDELIVRWREDPTWEIELTEGFEKHKEELLAVRLTCEAEWRAQAQLERANSITALIKPAHAWLRTVSAGGYLSRPALDVLLAAFAEMLLPLKQQLDEAYVELDSLRRGVDSLLIDRGGLP
jgi:hypothetical protein